MPGACGLLPRGVRAAAKSDLRPRYKQGAVLPPVVHCAKPRTFPGLFDSNVTRTFAGDTPARSGSLVAGPRWEFRRRQFSARMESPRKPRIAVNELLLGYLPLVVFIAVALGLAM